MISPVGGTPFVPPSSNNPLSSPSKQDLNDDVQKFQQAVNNLLNNKDPKAIQGLQTDVKTAFDKLSTDINNAPNSDFYFGSSDYKNLAIQTCNDINANCLPKLMESPINDTDKDYLRNVIPTDLDGINNNINGPQ